MKITLQRSVFSILIFERLKCSETLDMSFKQLGEVLIGETADTEGGKFRLTLMRRGGGACMRRPGSKDTHLLEHNFLG